MQFKLLICVISFFEISATENDRRPHIIFILADDLGWNDVSFHGSPEIPTPNIDALAASGIVLQNYYASPMCTPSRGSLMTGKYAIHVGLQHHVVNAGAPFGLPLKEKILPQYLKDIGYETHGVGKWHLGFYKKEFLPTHRGFDTYFGYWNGLIDYYDYTNYEIVNDVPGMTEIWGKDLHDEENTAKGYEGQYATDVFTDKALKIIKSHNSTKPLFLYMSHLAPHVGNNNQPLQAPFDYVAKFSYIQNMQRRIYAGVMSKLDESIGKIFKSLLAKNMLKNTILIFLSDNGAPAEGFRKGHGSNWPLRGLKMQMFEGGVKIPGLIWSPLFKLEQPRVSDQLMHISDWLPTLYAAAGGKLKDIGSIDGVNMWEHFLDNKLGTRSEILLNIDPILNQSAMIQGQFKIILGTPENGKNSWYGPSGHENLQVPSMDEWVWKNGSVVKDILERHHMWLIKNPDVWRSNLTTNCGCPNPYIQRMEDITQPQLFDLSQDPCEYINLAKTHSHVMKNLLTKLEIYNSSAVEPLFTSVDPHGDPRCFNFTYVPWLSDEYKSDCPYF